MLSDLWLVAAKDLRLELRTRVVINQILPFGLLVLVAFAFAVDADAAVLRRTAPGLFWVAIVLGSLLAVSRGFAIEAADGVRDSLRLADLDPVGVFCGKALALAVQLLGIEAILGVGIVVLYDARFESPLLAMVTAVAATVGLAAVGTIYGTLSLGLRIRETLLPLLVLPVVAPILLGASRAQERAMGSATGSGWGWVGLLAAIAVVYVVVGAATFRPLLEEA